MLLASVSVLNFFIIYYIYLIIIKHTSYHNFPIAREGWSFICTTIIASLIVQFSLGFRLAWPIWLFLIFLLQFFRNPSRFVPDDQNVVLSPADGRVVVVEHAIDPYLKRKALKISIFMNVFNVHAQRVPIDGKVISIEYFSGRFFNAALDKASENNERNVLIMETKDGQQISCVQIAGLIARRILCYASVGESLKRGERYGFIRFGSRLDVYLPANSSSLVMLGQKVYASSTILAKFIEKNI